ncbi:MAG: Xaa-Pro dipeptidase [Pseudomonadota bacterium]|jgi:Xaa-Pro dipeptidase
MTQQVPSPALFAEHIARLGHTFSAALEATGFDALVIGAGHQHYRFLDDQTDPFAVNPHFRLWAPIDNAPGSCLLIRPNQRPALWFHQPEDYWHKPPEMPTEPWLDQFELTVLRHPSEAKRLVPTGAAYIGEAFPGIGDWGFGTLNPQDLMDRLHWARAVKSDYELACMRLAARRGARAHLAAANAFHRGASEYGIHLAYLAASGHTEAALPYPNIIALNEGGSILHYTELQSHAPAQRRSLLIDAGAQFRGYACDITRTHAATPGGRFGALLGALDAAELKLCGMVRAGTHYPEIHTAAHHLVAEILVHEEIVTCSAEVAVESGLTAVFFPHGIGHLLGLQVHDIGGHQASASGGSNPPPTANRYLRLTRTLDAGTVVTIEPGIYFIDLLLRQAKKDGRGKDIAWDVVDQLRPYGGVRVEDDVVATTGAPENLTRDAFAEFDA